MPSIGHVLSSLAIGVMMSSVLAVGSSVATTMAETENVRVELIAEVEAVTPGEPFRLAIRQTIREGWHTYWSNPGDSGAATRLDWRLPRGVEAGPIQWPLPEAIPYFDLLNHGYEHEAVLLTELRMPSDWPVGEPLHIDVTVDWLVCADICIPESVELSSSLPSSAVSRGPHPINGAVFEEAAKSLPRPSPWPARLEAREGESGEGRLGLVLEGDFENSRIEHAHFFAEEAGILRHAAVQTLELGPSSLRLGLQVEEGAPPLEELRGLLVLSENPGDGIIRQGFELSAVHTGAAGSAAMSAATAHAASMPLWQAAFFAFLGGLILNLMPCVFPVLSMKALSLVRHAGEPGSFTQGLAYSAGVILSFLTLAVALLVLKVGGAAVGWGFQLQSPVVVTLLAYLMVGVGLWLGGAVVSAGDLGGRAASMLMNLGSGIAGHEGIAGSFFTGVLAVIVATPCTAPFMAPALGFALTADAVTALFVFTGLGAGFALPFLLLSASPGLQRLLPRPGPWMERLKEFLAFPMYATAAWLVWVLSQQVGPDALLAALMGLVLLGLGIWLLRFHGIAPRAVAAMVMIAALGFAFLPEKTPSSVASAGPRASALVSDGEHIEPFSRARLDDLIAEGRPVLVNMTAAWCITCLVNERVALASDRFETAMRDRNVAYLKGDWTNGDPEITAYLADFGRSGVPIYVLYPGAGAAPVLLPQILTESMVIDALDEIG